VKYVAYFVKDLFYH